MLNALAIFEENIVAARNQAQLYLFLQNQIGPAFPFDDLLRFQVVHSVSAFDKLIHDIIRIGMVETFTGRRVPTSKYRCEVITIEFHLALLAASMPPAEILFEQQIVSRLRYLSFQDPVKIADGLALIWDERHKWEAISSLIGDTADNVRTKLKLISGRRNAIVHEADMDPSTDLKTPLSREEAEEISCFLKACGVSIVSLVK